MMLKRQLWIKLKAGFKKFNYEAEFVKETKQEDKK